MPHPGCPDCTPYCWHPVTYPGYGIACSQCGRILSDQELVVVTTAPKPPRRPDNPWERGIRTDERGLPYLDSNGKPLRLGEPFDPRKYEGNRTTTGAR